MIANGFTTKYINILFLKTVKVHCLINKNSINQRISTIFINIVTVSLITKWILKKLVLIILNSNYKK